MRRVKFQIDQNEERTGVKAISLVEEPAIESDFIALSKNTDQYVELKVPGYKQVLAGLALIPDKDIPRVTPDGEKFIGYFTKDSIEEIRNKFHKQMMTASVNVEHAKDDTVAAYLIESFIIDSPERLADVAAKGIKNPVMGSWFVAYKIEDDSVFKEALSGKLKGFSVEIFVSEFSKAKDSGLADVVKKLSETVAELSKKVSPEYTPKDKSIYERKLKMNKDRNKNFLN